jgi:hypothetical protein
MKDYYILAGTLHVLNIIVMVLLIRKVWSYKKIEKSKKYEWTWIFILFNAIGSLIFIWIRMDQYEKLNSELLKAETKEDINE